MSMAIRPMLGRRDAMLTEMLDWYIRTADTVPVGEDPRGLPPS